MRPISILLALSLISTFSAELFAQESSSAARMGGGGFTVGYGSFPVSDLESFVPAGFNFSNDHLMLGGAGYSMIDRFVIGGSGSSVLGDEVNNDSLKMGLSGGYGTFDFGYVIVNKKRFKLFPMIGIGGGGYSLSISKRGNVSRSELVAEPEREIEISNGGFMMDFSVNMNFLPVYHGNDNSGVG
ncbi:MAG: hypothetical protein U5L96_06670 [Owenweeksia sp.]|nr:hypothetical protein [Owenweeksia sp.]